MPSRFDVRPRKNTTDIFIDVSDDTVAAAYEHERPAKVLDVLVSSDIFSVDRHSALSLQRYILNNKEMAVYADAPKVVVESYHYLYERFGEPDAALPAVQMSMEALDQLNSRYGMHVELRWPECDAAVAATFATSQMQAFARHLAINGKDSEALRKDLIYAQASRTSGVIFQTNPLGSCSIESDHRDYTDVATVELGMHNIYNHEQQLICLVGAVAFANADRHV